MNLTKRLLTRSIPIMSQTRPSSKGKGPGGPTKFPESFLSGSSAQYIEDMFNNWLENPSNVHKSWDAYFRSIPNAASVPIPTLPALGQEKPGSGGGADEKVIYDHLAVQALIRSYQARGHLVAKLDPLKIMYTDRKTTLTDTLGAPPDIITRQYKLNVDMGRVFRLPVTTFIGGGQERLPLHEIIRRLEMSYCRHIGVEFMYIDSLIERNFIRERMEVPGVMELNKEQKILTLKRLIQSGWFELFLQKKWASEKRFGLEGCEALIPIIKQIVDRASAQGVETFIIALSHRGRLNVIANVCHQSLLKLFTQFHPLEPSDEGSGDVKYHLGVNIQRLITQSNKNVRIAVVANPSHLEAVHPVALGRVRSEQFYRGDTEGKKCMAIITHGDASVCGQGVVFESFHLSNLPSYTTHGVIHIIVNNQIGFTADPRFSRSSPYCSDVGRVVNAPIFHVNADCPESCIHVAKIAADWRKQFKKDCVIDLVGYRKNGHNEMDEPMFTQPLMYTKIKAMTPIQDKYGAQLVREGVLTNAEVDEIKKEYLNRLEDAFTKAKQETKFSFKDWIDSPWSGFFEGRDPMKAKPTGTSEETLRHIGKVFSSAPPPEMKFVLHRGIERILKARAGLVANRQIDWALGEAMAYGSLLKEGVHVRLSGEDAERGTFSHRHHVLHHQTIDKATYCAMQNLYPDQAEYTVCNSSLSEYGVLGFEFGYSITNPNALVMWEAQFGDFANTAQPIFDQFMNSGQTKWVRQCGLVALLPHGFEAQGPEHSSARLERFLQLSADDPDTFPPEGPNFAMKQLFDTNWIVANCSTPANLFHILRRQIALPFRKPLILLTPKSLLKHAEVRSSFDEMVVGTEFQRMYPEVGEASKVPEAVKKVLLCNGKVYYELRKARNAKKLEKEIAISRIEQFTPFPFDLVKRELEKYRNAKVFWAQEEPKNSGAYTYVQPRISTSIGGERKVGYVGRPCSASPAAGYKIHHMRELNMLLADATNI